MIVKINSDGDLEVEDTTPYEVWDADGYLGDNWAGINRNRGENPSWKFIVLERIIAEGTEESELIDLYGIRKANSIPELRNNDVHEVPGNGLYHYQKLLIPYKSNHIVNPDKLYYDEITGRICQCDDTNIIASWAVFNPATTDNIVKPEFAEYFDDVFNLIVDNQYNSCFYYSKDTFSMYDLVECYVLRERARLQDLLKNGCLGDCDSNSKTDYELDLLLSAILVVDSLVRSGDFFEAQRILDSLDTCGNLCKDVKNKLKGCGCGRN